MPPGPAGGTPRSPRCRGPSSGRSPRRGGGGRSRPRKGTETRRARRRRLRRPARPDAPADSARRGRDGTTGTHPRESRTARRRRALRRSDAGSAGGRRDRGRDGSSAPQPANPSSGSPGDDRSAPSAERWPSRLVPRTADPRSHRCRRRKADDVRAEERRSFASFRSPWHH